MESQLLPTSRSKTQGRSDSPEKLIREWLFRFGVEHKEDVAPKHPLWLEAFGGMNAAILERLFSRALRTCKFFPKVSEILEPLANAEANAAPEAAEEAWACVLEIRRVHWNPDIPGPFHRALAGLSDRVRQAARAAGVFRDFTAEEFENGALHTWAKKRFVESFCGYGELEQDQFLLPDGEIKRLLADAARLKALPSPEVSFEHLHNRGLEYTEHAKARTATEVEGRELVKQLKALREQMSEEERIAINEELRQNGARFAAALERHGQETVAPKTVEPLREEE